MADSNDIIYTLRVQADSQTGTQQLGQDIQNATQQAQRSVEQLNTTLQQQNAWFAQTSAAVAQATQANSAHSQSLAQMASGVENLAAKYDPLTKATLAYNQGMAQLDQALAAGAITQAEYAATASLVAGGLVAAQEAAVASTAGVNALGMSANETVRHLRAMGDELAAGRMAQFDGSLLNVLTHIGMANPELALFALGLAAIATPIAATVVMANNYVDGVDEMTAKTEVYGNVSQITQGQMVDLVNQIGSVGNTSKSTAETLVTIGASAGLATDQIRALGEVSQTFANATHLKDADTAMKALTADLADPVDGFKKLGEQLNLFTGQDRTAFQQATQSNDVYAQRTIILNALIDRMNTYAETEAKTPTGRAQSIRASVSNTFTDAGAGGAGMLGMTNDQIDMANRLAEARQNLLDLQNSSLDQTQAGQAAEADEQKTIDQLTTSLYGSADALVNTGNGMQILTEKAIDAANAIALQLIPGLAQLQKYQTDAATLKNAFTATNPGTGASTESETEIDRQQLAKERADRLAEYNSIDPTDREIQNQQALLHIRQTITDPDKQRVAVAQYNARQQSLARGDEWSQTEQLSDLAGENAGVKYEQRKHGGGRDLTKGFAQQNTDQLALAGAYGTGDATDIAKQQAENEALEKTTYNTKTNVDALTQAILNQKAALADAQGAAALYGEKLQLVATQNETSGYESGGVAGLKQAQNENKANQQYDPKIAAAQAAGNQALVEQIGLQKQAYLATEQQIDASKQKLQLDQQEAANQQTIAGLQNEIAQITGGATKQQQDALNASTKVYNQLLAEGYQAGTSTFQSAYDDLLKQTLAIDQLNEKLQQAKQAQSDYKDEINEMGSALGNAFENGVLSGQSFRQVLANMLEDIAKIIFQTEVLKPLLQDLGNSSTGSGGALTSLFKTLSTAIGGLGGSAGESVAAPISAGSGVTVAGTISHWGSIAGGTSPNGMRDVDMSLFSGAPRFHAGGIVDGEVPIIAQQGEAVMPTVRLPNGQLGIQMAGSSGTGQGGTSVTVPVSLQVNYSNSNGSTPSQNDMNDFSNQMALQIQSAVDQRIGEWATNQARPGGVLSGTQSNRFGG